MKRLPIEMIKWRKAINKRIDKIDGQVDIVDNEMSYSYEIGNPVLRKKGEKLLMNIENGLIISFQESIETFGLEEVLEIREREAYDSNGDKIEDMSAVVIIELEKEDEIEVDKIYKLAIALQEERMRHIMNELKNIISNSFNDYDVNNTVYVYNDYDYDDEIIYGEEGEDISSYYNSIGISVSSISRDNNRER